MIPIRVNGEGISLFLIADIEGLLYYHERRRLSMASFAQKYIDQIKSINYEDGDRENWHGEADEILCDYLISIGNRELVEEWRKVPKWYA